MMDYLAEWAIGVLHYIIVRLYSHAASFMEGFVCRVMTKAMYTLLE
jgi:hypothetical protein